MKYLVIRDDELIYVDTASEALAHAGINRWELAKPLLTLRALAPGDELDINTRTSIIVLTGHNPEYKA